VYVDDFKFFASNPVGKSGVPQGMKRRPRKRSALFSPSFRMPTSISAFRRALRVPILVVNSHCSGPRA
jgi:hypothetical protein